MSDMLHLICFVLGDDPQDDVFSLHISKNCTVSELKEAIFAEKQYFFVSRPLAGFHPY